MMLHLVGHHTETKRMLKLSNTPRLARDDLLMARSKQQQIRQPGYAKGLLNPSLVLPDLVLAQPEVRLQLTIALFHWPPSLIRTHHLSRDPLVQSGHQDFRLFWAEVTPFFPQHHGDVADVPQTQAWALHPEGFAALGSREAGHPRALRICARPMRHQVFERFALDRFPCPGHGEHQASLTSRLVGVALHDPLPIVLRARGGIALDDNPLRPGGRDKAPYHLTTPRLFRLILRMAFRPNEPKSHRQTIDVPVDNQQGEADTEKPGVLLTLSPFLGQWILRAPLGFVTHVPNKMEVPILGRRQGVELFLDPPFPQEMPMPIARLAHAAKAPGRDLGRGPTGEFFQGFVPREEGLHANQPTQHEAVTTFPEAGHPTKQPGDEQGQIGDRTHSIQRRARGVGGKESGIPGLSLDHITSFSLIFKALLAEGVVFELLGICPGSFAPFFFSDTDIAADGRLTPKVWFARLESAAGHAVRL